MTHLCQFGIFIYLRDVILELNPESQLRFLRPVLAFPAEKDVRFVRVAVAVVALLVLALERVSASPSRYPQSSLHRLLDLFLAKSVDVGCMHEVTAGHHNYADSCPPATWPTSPFPWPPL